MMNTVVSRMISRVEGKRTYQIYVVVEVVP